jgi:hypothetical protein
VALAEREFSVCSFIAHHQPQCVKMDIQTPGKTRYKRHTHDHKLSAMEQELSAMEHNSKDDNRT